MPGKCSKAPVRRPRADAERNRAHLLATAKDVFASKGTAASLEEIARVAGVGIGTLYRHFPTRDALVEEVYRSELDQLMASARELATTKPPLDALRAWMGLFVGHMATKAGMAEVLASLTAGTTKLYAESGERMKEAMLLLTDRAVASGDIVLTIDPLDLLRALVGVSSAGSGPSWEDGARRMIDVLLAGLRPEPRPRPTRSAK